MKRAGILISILFFLTACSVKPRAIAEGTDICEFCKMTVMEKQYAAEFVTVKGKYFVFDDLHCMQRYLKENPDLLAEIKNYFVSDFSMPERLFNAEHAYYFYSEEIHTPMNGNTVAFSSKEARSDMADSIKGEIKTWEQVIK